MKLKNLFEKFISLESSNQLDFKNKQKEMELLDLKNKREAKQALDELYGKLNIDENNSNGFNCQCIIIDDSILEFRISRLKGSNYKSLLTITVSYIKDNNSFTIDSHSTLPKKEKISSEELSPSLIEEMVEQYLIILGRSAIK